MMMEWLPLEIQASILKLLTFSDLQNLKKVSKHFYHLVTTERDSWLRDMSLQDALPCSKSLFGLLWLSDNGNIEAQLKLAVILLYSRTADNAPTKTAKLLFGLEKSGALTRPITHVLIRPPWSDARICRKKMVFEELKKRALEEDNAGVCFSIGVIHLRIERCLDGKKLSEFWMEKAARLGDVNAKYLLPEMMTFPPGWWRVNPFEETFSQFESGTRLWWMRELREVALMNCQNAKIRLCGLYALGHHDGISAPEARSVVRSFFAESKPAWRKSLFCFQHDIRPSMRFVLVDWLIEVATLKSFGSSTLHKTVRCLDEYLRVRRVKRQSFQLIGIACMVLCSRLDENDVLSVREAVWLTDSGFTYQDLVLRLAEIVAAVKGNIQRTSILDYLQVLNKLKSINNHTASVSRFIADSTLLYADTGLFSCAVVACCCLLIANLTVELDSCPWNEELVAFTGILTRDLRQPAIALHENCISMKNPKAMKLLKYFSLDERHSRSSGPIARADIASYEKLLSFFEAEEESRRDTVHCPLTSSTLDSHRSAVIAGDSATFEDCNIDVESETPHFQSSACLDQAHARARKRVGGGYQNGALGVGAGRESESASDALPQSKSVKYTS